MICASPFPALWLHPALSHTRTPRSYNTSVLLANQMHVRQHGTWIRRLERSLSSVGTHTFSCTGLPEHMHGHSRPLPVLTVAVMSWSTRCCLPSIPVWRLRVGATAARCTASLRTGHRPRHCLRVCESFPPTHLMTTTHTQALSDFVSYQILAPDFKGWRSSIVRALCLCRLTRVMRARSL